MPEIEKNPQTKKIDETIHTFRIRRRTVRVFLVHCCFKRQEVVGVSHCSTEENNEQY